ncbi:MAG: hypothetical protein K9K81_02760 [Desulfobacteraceae bacterium]|nr:hypothetical protein [Desulfobacteraceae bacterium]
MKASGHCAGRTGFVRDLLIANSICRPIEFDRLLFFAGMRFGSRKSWWGHGRPRPQSHEGLDLCFFADRSGRYFRLDETVCVPAAFDSRVVAMIPDFLGTTVIAAHEMAGRAGRCLLFYAHITPDKGLHLGQRLEAGRCFARISGENKKRWLPPHLHLSMAAEGNLPPLERLDWPMVNRLDRDLFMDPEPILDSDFQMMDFIARTDLYAAFVPVSSKNGQQRGPGAGKTGHCHETP